jgi:hypothetical protein
VLNPLAMRCHPDLRVIWEYGDFNPKEEASIYEIRSKVEMTRNDVRLAQGMHPKGFWVPDEEVEDLGDDEKDKYESNPWNWPADPTFAQAVQQAQQMEQMAQQEQMGGGMGGPEMGGMPGEEPPPGNGFGGPPEDGFGGAQPPEGEPQDDGFGTEPAQYPYGQAPMEKARRARGWPTVYVHEQD